jgi:pimeloyl-ACP methyl ester carboxylesterase
MLSFRSVIRSYGCSTEIGDFHEGSICFLQDRKGREHSRFLPRNGAQGWSDDTAAAWLSLLVTYVRAVVFEVSSRYHLVAPDYPGFGHSDAPDPKVFAYTFDHIASIMQSFTLALGLTHYVIYMQDYGGPVGLRMAMAHPERALDAGHFALDTAADKISVLMSAFLQKLTLVR